MLRVWMQDSVDPQPFYEERPGRWVAEAVWPSPRIEQRRLFLNPGRLEAAPSQATRLAFSSPQTTGLTAGEWCAFGAEGEMPLEQRPDDGRSLTFDTEPLAEPLEILGAPVVELDLAADEPNALLAVRLNDVQTDGTSTLVTYGLLNLTHRDGHERPAPLEPGRLVRVRLQLNDIAHAFPAGHRLRVALSSSYWPIAWPSPEPVVLTVRTGKSALYLPVRPPSPDDHWLRPFEPPAAAHGSATAACTSAAQAHDRARPRHQRDRLHLPERRVRRGARAHRADPDGPRLHLPEAPPDLRVRPARRPRPRSCSAPSCGAPTGRSGSNAARG